MEAGEIGEQAVDLVGVRPSPDDRCAECGNPVDHQWISYRLDPKDPQSVIEHFGGLVHVGPVEPRQERPKRTIRDFHSPEDLGVFFHPWCAPRIKLPEKMHDEFADFLAKLLVEDYKKRSERWAAVWRTGCRQLDPPPPKWRAEVASVHGRRVFTMTRTEWEALKGHAGKLVEIDLGRTPAGSVGEVASAIASLAADCAVETERIEVWRYHATAPPTPFNVQDYLVLENLTRRLNVPAFAERASTQDSPKLRKYLRGHVFLVREQRDKGRWQPKARALERIVFLST